MIPLFTWGTGGEDWWHLRPDHKKWELLREELAERELTGGPPRHDKEDGDVHPWLRYALKVGWPAALATAIIAWWLYVGQGVLNRVVDLQGEIVNQHRDMQRDNAVIRERMDRAERMQGVVIDILRADCYNAAKHVAERDRCRDAGASR